MYYYDDCLEEEYLVTSTQTAFALSLLWEYTTLMIVNKCAFEGLAIYTLRWHISGLLTSKDLYPCSMRMLA